jgi:hypothetical protein
MYLQHLANSSTGPTLGDPVQEVRIPPSPLHSLTPHLTIPPIPPQIVRLQSAHLPGYNRALASSIRFGPIRGQSSSYTNLAKSERSVLLIHVRLFSSLSSSSLFYATLLSPSLTLLPKPPNTQTLTHLHLIFPGHRRPHSPLQIRINHPSTHPLIRTPNRLRRGARYNSHPFRAGHRGVA